MPIDDADTARDGSEFGRKKSRFDDLLLSIHLDIRDAQQVGSNSTIYKLSDDNMEFMEAINERLVDLGYEVKIDGKKLHIDWPPAAPEE